MDTVFAYGQNPATLREKYREGVELVLRSWTATEPFAFNGKYTQLRYVNVWPRPIQQPHPPVWVPGGGSVETWDWCVEHDFLYAYLSYFGYEGGRKTMERLYADHALYFYNRCLHLDPGFADAPGYRSVATLRRGVESQVQRAAAQDPDLSWKDILDRKYVVAGSPATVVDQLNELADTLRVGHLMLLCHFGDMPKEKVLYNTSRFIEDVAPQLRPRFDEWDDPWWPRDTLATPAEPGPLPAKTTV
jgi:alkanesulfonate monooxygenase SsuD/methylene tetrahydromethanopterin reductase-like flavin-dependent oxidoreductase (luciferase family)